MNDVYGTVTIKLQHTAGSAQVLMNQIVASSPTDGKIVQNQRLMPRKVSFISCAGVTQTEAAEIVSGWRLLNSALYDALAVTGLLEIEFMPEPMRWNPKSRTFGR